VFTSKSYVTRSFFPQEEERGHNRECNDRVGESELEKQRRIQVDLGNVPEICEIGAEGEDPEEHDESDSDII
jgi:hypothetical protein